MSGVVPNVIDMLREEHRNISRLLAVLDHQIDLFARAERPDYDVLCGVADYFLEYPDLCHHPKEDVIFRRLREQYPHDAEKLTNLESEHGEVGERARRFHEMVSDLLGETDIARDTIVDSGRMFVEAERRHMAMEEEQFFPIVQSRFTAEDWSHIDSDLAKASDPLFGDRIEAEFSDLRDKLLAWEQENLGG